MIPLAERSCEKEIMDTEAVDPDVTADAYRLIRLVNRFLGGIRVILYHLERFSKNWAGRPIRILDVASGSADIPTAVIDWARRKNLSVSVVALDSSPEALALARAGSQNYPEIQFIQAENPSLPFPPRSFDYVISSMFFHHLTETEITATLAAFDRISRRGIIINDLVRSPWAYWGIQILSAFTSNPVFRNDAALSVKRGFKREEAGSFIRGEVNYLKYYSHYAFRFALAGEKDAAL